MMNNAKYVKCLMTGEMLKAMRLRYVLRVFVFFKLLDIKLLEKYMQ